MIKLMYFDAPDESASIQLRPDTAVLVSINVLALIVIMPWIGIVTDICINAINGLS